MFGEVTAEKDSIRIIHRARNVGVDFIDTANVYNRGESDITVGRALVDHREHVVLTHVGLSISNTTWLYWKLFSPRRRGSGRFAGSSEGT